ncbi:MAG: hypothetical protein O3A25_19670 [Acidobacteria bacterium]|nr:hypothetical protein [Acidobacteriota bacterium]
MMLGSACPEPVVTEAGRTSSSAERQVVADAVATGQTDENDLTDLVFFGRYPEMEGTCADPASAEGKEWVILRDQLVRPVVKAASKTQAQSTGAATPPGDGESGADAAGGAQSGSTTAAVDPVSSTTDDVALQGTTGASALGRLSTL